MLPDYFNPSLQKRRTLLDMRQDHIIIGPAFLLRDLILILKKADMRVGN
jgi:hypothetical protein